MGWIILASLIGLGLAFVVSVWRSSVRDAAQSWEDGQ